jgi:predicted PurR-regulated permease PerM
VADDGQASGSRDDAATSPADEVDPLLDTGVRRIEAQADEQNPFGRPGHPLRRSPFQVAFVATLGVLLAYVLGKAIVATSSVLVLILVAAFLAVGLDPLVAWLVSRGMRRAFAVLAVLVVTLGLLAGFIAAIAPPIGHQASELVKRAPGYITHLQDENATVRRLDERYHVLDEVKKRAADGPTLGVKALGGVLGVGKAIIGFAFSLLTVIILMAYFLANMPSIKRFALRLVPRTRRARVGLLTDEIMARVGGYVLGNLATSLVAGLTTFAFLEILGIDYAIALGMFVAITDLIPLIGATIGALVVTVVALFKSVPAAVITFGFFIVYQQFENYVLQPRVMKQTVDVAPVVTIVAALIGAAVLGILGALLAIPVAAAVQLIIQEVVYPRQDES